MTIWQIETNGPLHGRQIKLLTPEELKELPKGTVLHDIFGEKFVYGQDHIDDDTRGGHLAFGILQDWE